MSNIISTGGIWTVLLVLTYFSLVTASYGQMSVAPQSTLLQTYQQEQRALAQERQALITQGATQQQIEAWQTKNAVRLEAQQERAKDMAAESAVESLSAGGAPNIPANASPTLKDFLTTQAALSNARAQIHNQLLAAMPNEVTEEQVSQMQQKEEQLFQQQYGKYLQLQTQRAQIMAQESNQTPQPVPGPASIPANATPQLAAYLTLHDQLMQEDAQLRNQYLTSTPAVRDAALEQWRQTNAVRFEQLQQLAQNLSTSTAN